MDFETGAPADDAGVVGSGMQAVKLRLYQCALVVEGLGNDADPAIAESFLEADDAVQRAQAGRILPDGFFGHAGSHQVGLHAYGFADGLLKAAAADDDGADFAGPPQFNRRIYAVTVIAVEGLVLAQIFGRTQEQRIAASGDPGGIVVAEAARFKGNENVGKRSRAKRYE